MKKIGKKRKSKKRKEEKEKKKKRKMIKRALTDAFIKTFVKEYDASKSSLNQQSYLDVQTLSNFHVSSLSS